MNDPLTDSLNHKREQLEAEIRSELTRAHPDMIKVVHMKKTKLRLKDQVMGVIRTITRK